MGFKIKEKVEFIFHNFDPKVRYTDSYNNVECLTKNCRRIVELLNCAFLNHNHCSNIFSESKAKDLRSNNGEIEEKSSEHLLCHCPALGNLTIY